jgi:hypothetical protein
MAPIAARLNDAIDRHRVAVIVTAVAWMVVALWTAARGKSFWHDEVYTILESQLPIGTLWRASIEGIDLAPPLNTIVTRGVHAVVGVGPVATRLPAMVGFLMTVPLIFATVRRRTNALLALAAALMPCLTPAWQYAIEARGYGLTLGLFAIVLYAWSEAVGDHRARLHWIIMAVALCAGVWTHYYFALAFVPVVCGEVGRLIETRRFAPAPWAALACAGLGVLPLGHLVAGAANQRQTFWTRYAPFDPGGVYHYVLGKLAPHRPTVVLLAGLAGVALLIRQSAPTRTRQLTAHEVAAGLACLAIPAAAAGLGGGTQVFTERYALFGAVGLAVALPHLVWWLTPPGGLGDLAAAIAVTMSFAGVTYHTVADPPRTAGPFDDRPLLATELGGADPTVVTGGVEYLKLWYAAPERARPRTIYLADPAAERSATGIDTVDRGYLALARWTPVPVVAMDEFVAKHHRFRLYSFGSDWVERSLVSRHAAMIVHASEPLGTGTLYDVRVFDP